MDTLPWIEKYRPFSLNDIISQDDVIGVLKEFIKNKCLPHLLLYGPPGTGKTSTITACAKELYKDDYPYMVMELNASDDRGIEVVRNRIIKFANTKSLVSDTNDELFKLIILDETDAMTDDAQAILRKVVENCASNTRFCLICNYIHNINPALQSRSTVFRFSPLQIDKIKEKLFSISSEENIKVTENGIENIAKKSRGDMRKALNILQSTSMAYRIVNEVNVNKRIGYPQKKHIEFIFNTLVTDAFSKSYDEIHKLMKINGLSLIDILHEIHDIIMDYIIYTNMYKYKLEILNDDQLITILDKIKDIEFNQSTNTTEDIQLSALISIFCLIKN